MWRKLPKEPLELGSPKLLEQVVCRKFVLYTYRSSCPVGKRKDVDDDADASNPRGNFRWKRTPLGAFPAFSGDFSGDSSDSDLSFAWHAWVRTGKFSSKTGTDINL